MSSSSLSEEQAYIDRSYGELARMRARAEELLESMRGVDPDLEWSLLRRVRALREDPRALCGRPVTVVASEAAKGLEFDAVVVVEPSAIVAERADAAAGLRLLYVALTRPTQHLSIVASGPLPAALTDEAR